MRGTNKEVIECWAHQREDSGRTPIIKAERRLSGNYTGPTISFEGKSLFSYRLCIAAHDGPNTFIIDDYPSMTTKRHISLARRAVNEYITTEYISNDPINMLNSAAALCKEWLEKTERASTHMEWRIKDYYANRKDILAACRYYNHTPDPGLPEIENGYFFGEIKRHIQQHTHMPTNDLNADKIYKRFQDFNFQAVQTLDGYRMQEPATKTFISKTCKTPEAARHYGAMMLKWYKLQDVGERIAALFFERRDTDHEI